VADLSGHAGAQLSRCYRLLKQATVGLPLTHTCSIGGILMILIHADGHSSTVRVVAKHGCGQRALNSLEAPTKTAMGKNQAGISCHPGKRWRIRC
jgi:hypothetical protein